MADPIVDGRSLIMHLIKASFEGISLIRYCKRSIVRSRAQIKNSTDTESYIGTWYNLLCYKLFKDTHLANTKLWPNVNLFLAHRLQRWPTIEPTQGQCPVFAGWIMDEIYRKEQEILLHFERLFVVINA